MSEKDYKASNTGSHEASGNQGAVESRRGLFASLFRRDKDKTLRQRFTPPDEGQKLIDTDPRVLEAYEYFKQNFALARDVIPQDIEQQFQYVVRNIALTAKDADSPSSLMCADYVLDDGEGKAEFIKALQDARSSGIIPPAAYNAIFLFKDKTLATGLLRATIQNYLSRHKFTLSEDEIALVISNILDEIKQSPTSEFNIDNFSYLLNIEIVYKYFQKNFYLDRNSLPHGVRQQFEYVVKNIALITGRKNKSSALMQADYDFEEDGKERSYFTADLEKTGGSEQIPVAAYNAIFLFKDKTLATAILTPVIRNYMSTHRDLAAESADEVTRNSVIQNIIQNILDEIRQSPASVFNLRSYLSLSVPMRSYASDVRRRVDRTILHESKCAKRAQATECIDSKYGLTQKWQSNPLFLNDKEMAEHFKRKSSKDGQDDNPEFLTTYFDSASIGLSFEKLGAIVGKLTEDLPFPMASVKYKPLILRSLGQRYATEHFKESEDVIYDDSGEDVKATVPKNVFVTTNGAAAADLLFKSCIQEGDDVELIVTDQEYGPILDNLLKSGKRVHVTKLNPYTDDDSYRAEIENKLGTGFGGLRYFLVSDVSRLGTNMPLRIFSEIRNERREQGDEGLRLIVDASQAVGRKVLNYDDIAPDAVFGSCQKGSVTASEAETVGFCVVSDDLYNSNQCNRSALIQDKVGGTIPQMPFIHAGIACVPESLNGLRRTDEYKRILPDDRMFERISASATKREKSIIGLSRRFAELVRAINTDNGNRIRILNPRSESIYLDDGRIDESRLSGVFECKIDGVSIDKIKQVSSREYGITIGDPRIPDNPKVVGGSEESDDGSDTQGESEDMDYFEEIDEIKDQTEKDSFRIAFHPYMGNDAVKMLGFMLMKLCQESKQ